MKLRTKIRPALTMIVLGTIGITAVGFVIHRVMESIATEAERPPESVVHKEGGNSKSPVKVPRELSQLKEDRDNELKLAHLELSHAASKFIESFAGFEDEIEQWGRRYRHYIRVSPSIAALGHRMRKPQEVDEAKNRKEVRAAVRQFRHALRQYDLKVKRIKFSYSQKLRGVIADNPEMKGKTLPPPKTVFEKDVQFAMWLEKREKHIIASYIRKIITEFDKPSGFRVIDFLRGVYYKDRGRSKDATAAERVRGKALELSEEFVTKFGAYSRKPGARYVWSELSRVRKIAERGMREFQTEQYEQSVRTTKEALSEFASVRKVGDHKAAVADAGRARGTLVSYMRPATTAVIEKHGATAWKPVQQLLDKADMADDPVVKARLYREATKSARKVLPAIVLVAAESTFSKGDHRKAFELLKTASRYYGNGAGASGLFARLIRKDPSSLIADAKNEIAKVTAPNDRVLCWTALAEVCLRSARLNEAQAAIDEAFKHLRKLPKWRRSIFIAWNVADRLLRGGDKKAAATAVEIAVKLLEDYPRHAGFEDEAMRIGIAGILHGMAIRTDAEHVISRCEAVRKEAHDRYLKTPRAQRGMTRNSRYRPALMNPDQMMRHHYTVMVKAASGDANGALKSAAKTNLGYTWGWLALVAVHDDTLRAHIETIRKELSKREWKREKDYLRSDSITIIQHGQRRTSTAAGLARTTQYFQRAIANSVAPRGSVSYTVSKDRDLFDIGVHNRRYRPGSYGDRSRKRRIYGLKEKGLYLFGQITETATIESKTKSLLSLYTTPISTRGAAQPVLQVGRYLGVVVAAMNAKPDGKNARRAIVRRSR